MLSSGWCASEPPPRRAPDVARGSRGGHPGDCPGGGRSGSSPRAWTALWLATRFGATFAEVTVLAFEPRASGVDPRAALRRALTVALGVALADAALESTLVFALGARLFAERPPVQPSVECPGTVANPPAKAVEAYKLAYWIARGVAFAVGYAARGADLGARRFAVCILGLVPSPAAAGGGGVPNRGTFLRYAAAVGAAHLASALAASSRRPGRGLGTPRRGVRPRSTRASGRRCIGRFG